MFRMRAEQKESRIEEGLVVIEHVSLVDRSFVRGSSGYTDFPVDFGLDGSPLTHITRR